MTQNSSRKGNIRRYIAAATLIILLGVITVLLMQPPQRYLTNGILVCEQPSVSSRIGNSSNETFSGLIQQFDREFSESADPDYQLLDRLLANNGTRTASTLEALSEFTQNNPQHAASAVYLLGVCTNSVDDPACSTDVIDQAVRLDRNNAVAWSLAASLRYSQGNSFGAAVALNSAVNAPLYNDYYQEQLARVKDKIPPVEAPYITPVLSNIYNRSSGLILDDYRAINPLVVMCRTEVGSNPRLAQTCLNYGERLEEQSSNLTGLRMGNRIRASTYSGMNNEPEARRIQSQGRQRSRELLGTEARLASDLVNYDSNLYSTWFDNVIAIGEPSAVEELIADAKRFSANEAYNPCPGTRFTNSLSTLALLLNEMF